MKTLLGDRAVQCSGRIKSSRIPGPGIITSGLRGDRRNAGGIARISIFRCRAETMGATEADEPIPPRRIQANAICCSRVANPALIDRCDCRFPAGEARRSLKDRAPLSKAFISSRLHLQVFREEGTRAAVAEPDSGAGEDEKAQPRSAAGTGRETETGIYGEGFLGKRAGDATHGRESGIDDVHYWTGHTKAISVPVAVLSKKIYESDGACPAKISRKTVMVVTQSGRSDEKEPERRFNCTFEVRGRIPREPAKAGQKKKKNSGWQNRLEEVRDVGAAFASKEYNLLTTTIRNEMFVPKDAARGKS